MNIEKKYYTLNDISSMSGTTLRTLRKDIASGILLGTKNSGKWEFTEADLNCYFDHPVIRQRIRSKVHAPMLSFIDALGSPKPTSCFIHDVTDEKESEKLNLILAEYAKGHANGNMCYTYFYDKEKHCGRFILIGTTTYIHGAMKFLG